MSLDEEFELLYAEYQVTKDLDVFYKKTRRIEEQVQKNPELLSPENQFDLYYENGCYLCAIKEYNDAIAYFEKAWQHVANFTPEGRLGSAINNVRLTVKSALGHAHSANGNNEKALENYIESLFWATARNVEGAHTLYSYREVNKYLLQDIINNEITVVNPKLFNDPLDCPALSIVKKIYGNIEEARDIKEIWEKAYSYFKVKSFVSNVRVKDNSKQSSTGIDNTEPEKECCKFLMWSHYAKDHTGVCIKYRIDAKFLEKDEGRKIASIIYDVDYKESLNPTNRIEDFRQAFATKSICWKYENEVRLIHYDPNCSADFKSLPLGKHASIEAVYFGLRCPAKDIDTIKAILGDDVSYLQMKEDDEDIFKLVEMPLNDKAKAMLEAASEVVAEIVE